MGDSASMGGCCPSSPQPRCLVSRSSTQASPLWGAPCRSPPFSACAPSLVYLELRLQLLHTTHTSRYLIAAVLIRFLALRHQKRTYAESWIINRIESLHNATSVTMSAANCRTSARLVYITSTRRCNMYEEKNPQEKYLWLRGVVIYASCTR